MSLNELDPADDSVGYGGLPNADGVVQLDASVMNVDGNPDFDLRFYVLDSRGRFAGVSLYADYKGTATRFAVATEKGAEERSCEALLESCPKAPSG